ncbi:MAG: hypothetical protein HY519_02170 [Candidatus Aenigmarchaeota archaeon]|nr:hypothetical protein [Candidatus Aenigmarchaeota archaeon]
MDRLATAFVALTLLGLVATVAIIFWPQRDRNLFLEDKIAAPAGDGEHWEEAALFLAENTEDDAVILSWVDYVAYLNKFGGRSTIPNLKDSKALFRKHQLLSPWIRDAIEQESVITTAEFLTADVQLWEKYYAWLESNGVNYILVDYTMPDKFSTIWGLAHGEDRLMFPVQVAFKEQKEEEDGLVLDYTFNGGYGLIRLRTSRSENITGPAEAWRYDGISYSLDGYITEFCTVEGIVTFDTDAGANKYPEECVAISYSGIFVLPAEIRNSIFASLFFMNGYRLPLDLAFDNGAIKIYRITG